jgi:lipid II:glycine glycyltransferase (peptidoglycan interpeptide bridge formation enzyme)
VSSSPDLLRDAAAWDQAVLASGGHFLQSWGWGEFKSKFGWDVARVAAGDGATPALAQMLVRRKAGASVGYIPRGPVHPATDEGVTLWRAIGREAIRQRALFVIVEANEALPPGLEQAARLTAGPSHIQPARTVKVPLLDDELLLKQMHQKTRYNVRLAQRRGVSVRRASHDTADMDAFYALMQDTAQRNAFGVHERRYYEEFLRTFGDAAAMLFAEIDGRPVAGVIAVSFGNEAIYMYGASSTKDRAHGAGFYIQYEAMRWAREQGCTIYDLWGIPALDPSTTHVDGGDRIAGTSGSDWRGLYEFKTRFGGQIVSYPAPLERIYVPGVAHLAKRVYSMGGGE